MTTIKLLRFPLLILLFYGLSIFSAMSQEEIKEPEENEEKEIFFHPLQLFPSEVRYMGGTDFNSYYNGITVAKLIFGITDKYGLSGDGLNIVYDVGIAYNYFLKSHYLSLFPQLGGVTWWGANGYLRSEPLLNLRTAKIDYISGEISAGFFGGSASLFTWVPLQPQNKIIVGLKIGFYLPIYVYFKERKYKPKKREAE